MLAKEELGNDIYRAEKTGQPIAPLTETYPDLTPDQAYAAQLE